MQGPRPCTCSREAMLLARHLLLALLIMVCGPAASLAQSVGTVSFGCIPPPDPLSNRSGPPHLLSIPGYITYANFSQNRSTIMAPPFFYYGSYAQPGRLSVGCGPYPGHVQEKARGSIVFVSRGNCSFTDQATHAAMAGAVALVVVNYINQLVDPPPIMKGSYPSNAPRVVYSFQTVMATYGMSLDVGEDVCSYGNHGIHPGQQVLQMMPLQPLEYTNGDKTMVFYACGIMLFSGVLAIFMKIFHRGYRPFVHDEDSRQRMDAEQRVDAEQLMEELPQFSYRSADAQSIHSMRSEAESGFDGDDDVPLLMLPVYVADGEVPSCCICLEDYTEGDKLMRMPCKHDFHRDCIGPWLSRNRTCPLCKRDVFAMHRNQTADTDTRHDEHDATPAARHGERDRDVHQHRHRDSGMAIAVGAGVGGTVTAASGWRHHHAHPVASPAASPHTLGDIPLLELDSHAHCTSRSSEGSEYPEVGYPNAYTAGDRRDAGTNTDARSDHEHDDAGAVRRSMQWRPREVTASPTESESDAEDEPLLGFDAAEVSRSSMSHTVPMHGNENENDGGAQQPPCSAHTSTGAPWTHDSVPGTPRRSEYEDDMCDDTTLA